MQQRNLTRGSDEIRINVNDTFELKYWAKKFGVTTSEVKSAVKAVGDALSAVHSQLESNKKNSNDTCSTW
ncbi:hypothetical protein B723_01055 [Pseudomonas fluorescens NCIMB 11764]|uniref:DUF3606 domain-containing protein n=2 Tax=Pseudomonas fluorescens group TaxID=136843 RepID=A0AB36D510_9PSED|nr:MULTISPECIES: DUF3606 domain-containing protein [Pseudomonas]AKV05041.1 hypothetical protein B723_01055 [Pseudomonas fluorescens NCIMB 11764]NMZ83633.1 DUF3606 domain-containing protein [Pseudomonas mandelii]OOL33683.1 hypothetical protein BOO94_32420 [Pseudomonas sp. FSL W5-0299]